MKRSLPELENPVIAIYDDNFSADEIKQLVAFYQSPVGRKIVIQLPQLMQQSVSMGQSWGQQAGARAVERIRAVAKQRGYDLAARQDNPLASLIRQPYASEPCCHGGPKRAKIAPQPRESGECRVECGYAVCALKSCSRGPAPEVPDGCFGPPGG